MLLFFLFQTRNGSFTEDAVPSHMFALEEDIFISCNEFRNQVLVHIRRYRKFKDRYYPTKEGVTLTAHQFASLVSNNNLRNKSTEKPKDHPFYEYFIDLPPMLDPIIVYSDNSAGIRDNSNRDNVITITFSDSIELKKEYTCRSGTKFSSGITLQDPQYDQIFSISDIVMDTVCILRHGSFAFKELFEEILGFQLPAKAPEDDPRIANNTLLYILKVEIYIALSQLGELVNPHEVNDRDCLSKNTLQLFYNAILNLKFYDVVRNFYFSVKKNNNLPLLKGNLLEYVTEHFFNSVDMIGILQNAKSEFCINVA